MPGRAEGGAIGAALLAAYRRTEYRAGSVAVRLGRRSPAADAWLRARGAAAGVFLTAWNPLSRRMPAAWNERMLRRLRGRLRRFPHAEGWGTARGWRERHLLAAGDPRPLIVLARRFRQRAIVVVRRGQPARLVVVCRGRESQGPSIGFADRPSGGCGLRPHGAALDPLGPEAPNPDTGPLSA